MANRLVPNELRVGLPVAVLELGGRAGLGELAVHLGGDLVGGHLRVAGDVGRIALLVRTHFRVEHVGAVEKVGVGGSGLQSRYRDARVLQLISELLGEGEDKCFRCAVHGLERRGHLGGDP